MEKENKEPFLMLKGRRGLMMGIHKDYYLQYHRDLWRQQEDMVKSNHKVSEKMQAYTIMYDECMKRIQSLMGIPASLMGSEQGGSGSMNGR